jgi:hypothetical protein
LKKLEKKLNITTLNFCHGEKNMSGCGCSTEKKKKVVKKVVKKKSK